MKVILLQDVKALGKKGEVVNVNDGYARNFILPKKLGVEANGKNLNDLKLQKNNEAKVAQEHLDAAKKLAEELRAGKVVLTMKVGEGGRTFGSVSSKEIAEAVKEQMHLDIDKKKIQLKEQIKTLGTHIVSVKLHPEVTAVIPEPVHLGHGDVRGLAVVGVDVAEGVGDVRRHVAHVDVGHEVAEEEQVGVADAERRGVPGRQHVLDEAGVDVPRGHGLAPGDRDCR